MENKGLLLNFLLKENKKIGILLSGVMKRSVNMPIRVSQEACIGCGACIGVCPTEALVMNADGKVDCNDALCIDCGACIGTCPVEAISQ